MMEHHAAEFIFPNDLHGVAWTVMIVLYPYITGLVAGAFVVAALYHVFGKKEFAPVARFALAASFSFAAFATLPLLLHLHQPQRAFFIMFMPNFTSAMAGFGFIYSFYLTLLAVEILLVFRSDIVAMAQQKGVKGLLYKALSLGVLRETAKSKAIDAKWVHALSVIGIPGACILHGYVGFIFGGIKANPWWSTALMPVIFLSSAIVSGVAMLILLYILISKIRKVAVDDECLRGMMKLLWLFLILAVTLESLETLNMAYEAGEEWHMIHRLITEKLRISFLYVQLLIGSAIPFVLLLWGWMKGKSPKARIRLGTISGLLVLMQVLAMRFNVVIGGQMLSKSFRGFVDYVPEWYGREGIFVAIGVFSLPFILLTVVLQILPVWKIDAHESH